MRGNVVLCYCDMIISFTNVENACELLVVKFVVVEVLKLSMKWTKSQSM